MLTRVLVPKFHSRVTRGIVQHRQASSGSHDHDDPHSSHGTGWPKPSGRGQFKPVSQEEVNTALAKAQKGSQGQEAPPSIREEVLALEGWLFGKKVIYLNTKEPWYNQIPNEQQYLFGERVCDAHNLSHTVTATAARYQAQDERLGDTHLRLLARCTRHAHHYLVGQT